MSENNLDVIESSTQKTYEWIASVEEVAHLERRDAYKSLRAVLQTLRDRLPLQDAVHLAAQLPTFLRGLFFEGWEPAKVPLKMSRDEFLAAVAEKIVADKFIDPVRITHCVLEVLGSYVAPGESEKVKHCLPKELQSLWPELTPAL